MGGNFSTDTTLRVKLKDLIEELLGPFFDKLTVELQILTIKNLVILIQQSPFNGNVVSKLEGVPIFQNLLSRMIQTTDQKMFDEIFKLLALIMNYNCTNENLRKYFETMYYFTRPEDNYIHHTSRFNKMLRGLYSKVDTHPENFFDFDGLFSGFELPPISSFPNSFTFTCWFRAESFTDPTQFTYSPCLFSFCNADGVGLDVSFVTKKNGTANLVLKYVTLQNWKKEVITTNTDYNFSDKCWYFVAITHTSSSMLRKSEISVVVNGIESFRGIIKYPNFTVALTKCFIGTSHIKHKTFFGQITGIQMFKQYLEPEEIRRVYYMGLNYNLTLGSDTIGLSKKLCFSFHPKATIDDVVLDTSSDLLFKFQINVQSYDARKIANTYVATGNSISSSIVSVGGIDIIYPLFLYPPPPQNECAVIDYTPELVEQLHRYYTSLLTLIVSLLDSQTLFQNQVTNRNAFREIRLLLQHHAPFNLFEDMLEPIEKMIIMSETNSVLRKQLFQDFLFSFSLWSAAEVNFQKSYLNLLTSYILNDAEFFQNNSIDVEFFLEILQDYYWFTEHPYSQLTDEVFSVTSSTLTEFKRAPLSKEEISELRSYFLKFIKNSVLVIFSTQDAQSIINYVQSCKDNSQVEDLLQLILEILLFGGNSKKILSKFDEVGSILPFLSFLSNEDESLRILALKLIGALINIDSGKTAVMSYVTSSKTSKMIKDYSVYSYIWCALNDFSMTRNTYYALFEVATGRINLEYINPTPPNIIKSRISLKNYQFLRILFSLLSTIDTSLKEEILQDFYNLLLKNESAKQFFVNDITFISWLASLFKAVHNPQPSKKSENVLTINNLVIDLISLVFSYCAQQKDAWKGFELFDNALNNYFELDPVKNLHYQFEYYTYILHLLSDHMNYLDLHTKNVPTIFITLGYVTIIIDEYLFCQQEFLNQKRRLYYSKEELDEVTKKDLFTVLKILDLLDPLLSSSTIELINQEMIQTKKRTLYVTTLRLILHSLVSSYETDYISPKEHFTFLDKSSLRLQYILGKLVKFNSCINVNIWVLHYLMKCSNYHYDRYNGILQNSTSKIIQEILNNCRNSIESSCNIPLPDIRQETSSSLLKDTIISLKYNTDLMDHIENIAKALERDLSIALKNSIDRRRRRDDDLINQNADEALFELSNIERNAAIRRKNWVITEVKSHREIEYKWESYYKYIIHNDKYPWLFCNKFVYWKLDLSEDRSRRRWKYRINYDGDHLRQLTISPHPPITKRYQLIEHNEELKSFNKLFQPIFRDEVSILSVPCLEILFTNEIKGKFHITDKAIYFFALDKSDIKNEQKDRRWPLTSIEKIYRMRYVLRNSALEIYFTDRRSYFFTFPGNVREKVYSAIVRLLPPTFLELFYKSSTELHKHLDLCGKWQRKEIGNFEYLMHLNTLASRSLNDLSQYPVFPWVLVDYQSPTIDLKNPAVYRDLSKPIGALNPTRLEHFEVIFEENDDPLIPKFYYGTHYSNPLIVLLFLMRMEPYTTYYLLMQGGIDRPDRLFSRIDSTWNGCYESPQDLRELVPEFFYNPQFLCNQNKLNLGVTQDHVQVSDVILPPWANNSPDEFIRINREALESEFVSEHLHEWIDLIFGFKQTGHDAVKAKNVFVHKSYENATEIEDLEECLRAATIEQILLYGQCPVQLFTKPHPPRRFILENDVQNNQTNNQNNATNNAILGFRYLDHFYDRATVFHMVGHITVPFTPRQIFVSDKHYVSFSFPSGQYQFQRYFNSGEAINTVDIFHMDSLTFFPFCSEFQNPARYSVDIESNLLFSAQHWDNSVRVSLLKNPTVILYSVNMHHSNVSCIELSESLDYLVSGEVESSMIVWEVRKKQKELLYPLRVLSGCDSKLKSLAVNSELDLVVSGYINGSILIHTLHTGFYIRTIHDVNKDLDGGVDLLKITSEAKIVAYSNTTSVLVVYDANGNFCAKQNFPSINCITTTPNGKYIVIGSQKLTFLRSHDLSTYYELDSDDEICSFAITPGNEYIFVGTYASGRNIKVFSLKEHDDLYYNYVPLFVNDLVVN